MTARKSFLSNAVLLAALVASGAARAQADAGPLVPDAIDEPPQMLEAIQEPVVVAEPEDFTEAILAFVRVLREGEAQHFWQCTPFDSLALGARDVVEEASDTLAQEAAAVDTVIGLASLEPPAPPLKLLYSSIVPPQKKRPVAAENSWLRTAQGGGVLAAYRAISLPAQQGPRFSIGVVGSQSPVRWQTQMRAVQPGEPTGGPIGSEVLMVKTDASANTLTPVPEPLRVERMRLPNNDPLSVALGVGLAGRWNLPLSHRLDFDTVWQERRFRDGAQRDGGVRQMGLALGTPTFSGFSGQLGLKRADESPRDPWLALRADEVFLSGTWAPAPASRFTLGVGQRRTRFSEVDPATMLARDDRQDKLTLGYVERVNHSVFGPLNFGLTLIGTRSRVEATGFESQAREARLTVNKTF